LITGHTSCHTSHDRRVLGADFCAGPIATGERIRVRLDIRFAGVAKTPGSGF